MGSRAMKSLLAALGREAAGSVERPAAVRDVMRAFCRAMSARTGRPVELLIRAFPADLPISGLRLDLGDRSVVVVEERTAPEAQLVILGHELWHEECGDGGHGAAGARGAAARGGLGPDGRAAALEILAAQGVIPRDALLSVAARAESADACEVDAETFGLLFGREVRTWVHGRWAEGPVTPATVEGRMRLSLTDLGGRLL
ncbi:toxin [Streptomyces sp. NPDC003717]|uniref:toxin n=1 Tax=Streptomyces sp. NPDC003717 TaxID=3154276 RepID=UPI0033BB75BD